MGVSNVNNTNNIVKLALTRKAGQTTRNIKPLWQTDNGSIFNAPGVNDSARQDLTELNIKRTVGKNLPPSNSTNSNNLNPDNFEDIDNVASGKKAISTGRSAIGKVKGFTSQTENDEKTVRSLSQESANLNESIKDNDKAFAGKLKADQKDFNRDSERLKKLTQETQETQKEVENAQHELDKLATNSFSIQSGGNQARINELQGFIGSKVALLQNNGKAIYSLQRSQTRTLARMNKTNKMYINTQKANTKHIQSQQNTNNKLIDTASKIEQYSAMAQAGGQAIGLAGEALIALGNGLASTVFGSGAGAALITVGTVMKKVGSVLELVGEYGQTAANITKTAAYAADGNIMGAMQSAATAMQTGAAAVKGTKNLGENFKAINQQATAAKQNIAAKAAAKETVNNMTEEQLGGLSKKEARKYVTADLRKQLQDGKVDKFSDMKTFAETQADGSIANAKNAYAKDMADARETLGLGKEGNTYQTKDGKTKFVSDKKIKRQASKEFKVSINDIKKKLPTTSTNTGKMIEQLGGSITNIAMVFAQNKAMQEFSNHQKKHLEPFQMDARTRRIMEQNQRYRMHYV